MNTNETSLLEVLTSARDSTIVPRRIIDPHAFRLLQLKGVVKLVVVLLSHGMVHSELVGPQALHSTRPRVGRELLNIIKDSRMTRHGRRDSRCWDRRTWLRHRLRSSSLSAGGCVHLILCATLSFSSSTPLLSYGPKVGGSSSRCPGRSHSSDG